MSTRGRTSPPPPGPGPLGTSTAPMTARTWPAYCFGFILTSELFVWHVTGLQCYACNVGSTRKTIDVGCFHPEIVTCSQSHKGFKHRFCIKTENTASGIALTSGCATSRHCQQQELPGMRIYCCDSDLCNGAPYRRGGTLHCLCTVLGLLLLWLQQ